MTQGVSDRSWQADITMIDIAEDGGQCDKNGKDIKEIHCYSLFENIHLTGNNIDTLFL